MFNFSVNKFDKEIYIAKEHFDRVLIIKNDMQQKGVDFIGVKDCVLFYVFFSHKKREFSVQKFEHENKERKYFSIIGAWNDHIILLYIN